MNNPQTIYLKDYTVPDYFIDHVELTIHLDDEHTQVSSQLSMRRNPNGKRAPLKLNGENLTLLSVRLNRKELSDYQQTPDYLIIDNLPDEFVLNIDNVINPKANTALEGLYLSNGMLCTQCEAEGFRKITYFLDRPDVMTKFTTTLIGDKTRYPVLLSNGNKIKWDDLDNNQHFVTWQDPFAKPCYLFALVAGQLECVSDKFTTLSGRHVDLQIFVEAHDIDKCDHAMQSLKHAMRWDEEVYGLEYDLDLYMIVAVSHFNMGAMENKGLNIFNTKFVLARPDTATDVDYEGVEGVIAHEYFHNWTGNRVTCRDWFQLSLKEGFTVFRDQSFSADRISKGVKRVENVNALRTRQFPEDAGPLAHPIRPEAYIEINNFYTMTVYEKGAEVVRMIHTLLGSEGFRKGCDLYFARHDGQAVTCEDFVKAMEDATGKDLKQFRRWYEQAGTPVLTVKEEYVSNTGILNLTIKQYCPDTPNQTNKPPLHIPVTVGLLNLFNGKELPIQSIEIKGEGKLNLNYPVNEVVLELTKPEQTFVFKIDKEFATPVVSLLRNFSAPVKLEMPRGLDELAFLLSHDKDAFNRWEAGQNLAINVILGLVDDIKQQRPLTVNATMIDAFKQVLNTEWDDLSYFSLLLNLPSEIYLAEQMQVVDVEAIHQARELVIRTLAETLQNEFKALYQAHHRDESGVFDSGAIGRRRVKNACLAYLSKLPDSEVEQWASTQFKQAGNMTDQMAALTAIVYNDHAVKADSLAAFYQQWQNEALVVDKWFTLQASSPAPDTFENIQNLMQHPAFDLKNPNRVRSLIGAFSQNNHIHFHAANGQGYEFLANQIIALNTLNPQVASRMLNALTSWRRFDNARQDLMKAQLERIINTPDISKDVYEIASKSLA